MTTIWVEGYRDNSKEALIDGAGISARYFSTMQTTLIAGRFFTDAERDGSHVVMVNQSFVRKYFPHQDALGKRLGGGPDPKLPWQTIVGVVADVHYDSLDQAPVPRIYAPLDDPAGASVAVRSSLPPDSIIAVLRAAVRSIDPSIALADVQTMQQAVAASTARRRFQTTLLTIFAGIALPLALVGLYGLLCSPIRCAGGSPKSAFVSPWVHRAPA